MAMKVKEINEVNDEIKKLLKNGVDIPVIVRSLYKKFDSLADVSQKNIELAIENEIEQFKGYHFIRAVSDEDAIILSPNNSNGLFLYNSRHKTKTPINESDLRNLCNKKWTEKLLPCTQEYQPYKNADVIQNDDGLAIFNTYKPAAWRKEIHYNGSQPPLAELPEVYNKFFSHLFSNDEDSINFVLDWLCLMLTGKNFTYLVTIGTAGAGKGTLGEIIKGLVGSANFVTLPFKKITRQFNGQLMDKLAIYLDEVMVEKDEQEDLLKMLVNDDIDIERKNIDAKSVGNFASVYLSSNNLHALKIKSDDRRYSLTELTTVPFKQVFTIEFRDELLKEKNIESLGFYLLNRKIDMDKMRSPFLSNQTLMAKQSSLKEWEDYLLSSVAYELAGTSIDLVKLNDKAYEELNSKNFKLTAKSLSNLSQTYPGFFIVKRETRGNRKIYVVTFKPLEEQPRNQLVNLEVSDDSEGL